VTGKYQMQVYWYRIFDLIEIEYIRQILESTIIKPISLFSLKLKQARAHILIEIELDHLENRFGSVSIEDCERISHLIKNTLEIEKPDLEYILNVSSAGAERELKIPEDLFRFKELPLKLKFFDSEGKEWNQVVKLKEHEGENLIFETFKSKRIKEKRNNFSINIKDIRKGNLYLEY
jgi:ribosome maturation factor RimP